MSEEGGNHHGRTHAGDDDHGHKRDGLKKRHKRDTDSAFPAAEHTSLPAAAASLLRLLLPLFDHSQHLAPIAASQI